MNKKTPMIVILILLLSILTGCVSEKKSIEQTKQGSSKSAPIAIITAPERAYFGENIEFDASKSYDKDGEITIYSWDFGDGNAGEGEIVEYNYKFENEFNMEYPIVFSVLLYVLDDDEKLVVTQHQIMIYPHEYRFYLDSERLTTQELSSNSDRVKASLGKLKSNPPGELVYKFDEAIKIQPCMWDLVIFVEKPRFTVLDSVHLIFQNETKDEILEVEKSFRNLNIFWKEQKITISGEIVEPMELKTVKLTFFGFSIREKINVLYGGDSASYICFNFTGFYSPII